MRQLKVIGAEGTQLVLATENGERFTLPIDETLRAELRRARADVGERAAGTRPSPREIQAHIRSGLTAEEVAALLGASLEDVERFEAPILAEREHVVGLALAVPVLLGAVDDDNQSTFGGAIRDKLTEAGASNERWTSWREPESWIVKCSFELGGVERDARWAFDPRRGTLSPGNQDAAQLSKQGGIPEALTPKLRALDTPILKDETRFDSGAFGPRHTTGDEDATVVHPEIPRAVPSAVTDAAIKRAENVPVPSTETADLLEALRRRRGQRSAEATPAATEGSHPVALFDALEPGFSPENGNATTTAELPSPEDPDPEPAIDPAPADTTDDSGARKRGRPSMPSWDEIVFGARKDAD